MEKYRSYLLAKGYQNSTITEHLSIIHDLSIYLDAENVKVAETSYNDVISYIHNLEKKGLATSTKKIRISVLKKYFQFLIITGKIKDNPILGVKLKVATRRIITATLTNTELDDIYHEYTKKTSDTKSIVLLGLIIYQGLTSSDIKSLLVTDIHVEKGVIYVPETGRSNERLLPLDVKQVFPLVSHINLKRGEKLFDHILNNLLATLIQRLKNQVGYQGAINELRVSRIMLWIKQHNLRKVQYLCGFKYISSLEKYRVSEIEDLRRKLEACFGE